MNLKNGVFISLFFLSIGFNLVVLFLAGVWWLGRTNPIVVNPREMHRVIRGLSINSASEWRLIKVEPGRLIVEYRLPPYDITRYALPARYFKLSSELENKEAPYLLSYEGCDLLVNEAGDSASEFKCMKLRNFSSGDE